MWRTVGNVFLNKSMQSTQSIAQLLTRLWRHISSRRRGQLGLLIILMLGASFAEIISIGAVLPFLVMLTTPERLFEHAVVQPIIHAFGLATPKQLLLPLTIAFGMAAIIAGVMRLLLLWANTRLSFAIGADLSIDIYRRTLYQPYLVHCARNSSEVISGISSKMNGTINVLAMLLALVGSVVMLGSILIVLLSLDPMVALTVFGGFGLIYVGIDCLIRKQLLVNGVRVVRESTHVIKAIQEGLGCIRDVHVIVTEWKAFKSPDFNLVKVSLKNPVIFDSRNLFEPIAIKALGFEYCSIGR